MGPIKNHKPGCRYAPLLLSGFLLLGCLLASTTAWADDQSTNTNKLGTFFFNGTQYCDPTTFDSAYGLKHITSTVICEFLLIVNQILVDVYNGIQVTMRPVVQAMLTLYIAIFGAQLLMGTARLQARDIIGRLIKIAAVWVFSTDLNYGVGIAFNFFLGIVTDAGQAIITAAFSVNDQAIPVCGLAVPKVSVGVNNPSNVMPLFGFFDALVDCAFVGPVGQANSKVIGFFLVVATIIPQMSMIFCAWALSTFIALARLVLSFLTSLAAIAFLIALAPIFLSLMLFQSTSYFFDNWIRYLIAYSVQIVLSFGVTVLWIVTLLNLVYFFNDLSNIIYPYHATQYAGNYANNTDSWAICDADYWIDDNNQYHINQYHAECKACKGSPLPCDQTAYFADPTKISELIPPSSIISPDSDATSTPVRTDFIQYVFTHLVTLLTLSYAFSILLQNVCDITNGIVGVTPMPKFLGGLGSEGGSNSIARQEALAGQNRQPAAKAEPA